MFHENHSTAAADALTVFDFQFSTKWHFFDIQFCSCHQLPCSWLCRFCWRFSFNIYSLDVSFVLLPFPYSPSVLSRSRDSCLEVCPIYSCLRRLSICKIFLLFPIHFAELLSWLLCPPCLSYSIIFSPHFKVLICLCQMGHWPCFCVINTNASHSRPNTIFFINDIINFPVMSRFCSKMLPRRYFDTYLLALSLDSVLSKYLKCVTCSIFLVLLVL